MRPSTKRVPAAFHSELTEYASLLRAIRTSSKLDIVPQLIQANPHVGDSYVDSDQEGSVASKGDAHVNDGESERESSESVQEMDVQRSLKGKEAAVWLKDTRRSRRQADDDVWTRWPLLRQDCPRPEWTFDDEVVAIAEQCFRFQSGSSETAHAHDKEATAPDASDSDSDDMSDLMLSPAYLSGLASETTTKLDCIFSLLASHRVNATFAKHGRLSPMSWVDVLEVVGVAGLFDLATIQNVKERLEAIYGPSDSQVITRMQVLEASDRALAEAEIAFAQDLYPTAPPIRR